jgi:hypothetical protein
MEFFLSFWDLLGPVLVRILNIGYRTGQLRTSQRRTSSLFFLRRMLAWKLKITVLLVDLHLRT